MCVFKSVMAWGEEKKKLSLFSLVIQVLMDQVSAYEQKFKEMGTRMWAVFCNVGGSTGTPGGKDGL